MKARVIFTRRQPALFFYCVSFVILYKSAVQQVCVPPCKIHFPEASFFFKILAFCLIGSLRVSSEATVRKQSQLIPIGSDPPATLGTP